MHATVAPLALSSQVERLFFHSPAYRPARPTYERESASPQVRGDATMETCRTLRTRHAVWTSSERHQRATDDLMDWADLPAGAASKQVAPTVDEAVAIRGQ